MALHLVDAEIPVSIEVRDSAGNLQAADSAPALTVESPAGTTTTVTLATASTGVYTGSFTPDVAGLWVGTFTATVDTIDTVQVPRWTVHDGQSEANREGFPQGLQSWTPGV